MSIKSCTQNFQLLTFKNASTSASGKHIAIYLPTLHGGGAERVMVTLANNFVTRDFRVDLILASAEGEYLKDVSKRVRIVNLHSTRVLFSLPRLASYLRRERPDAMLSAMSHANIIAIWARQLARVSTRLVASERNTLSSSMKNSKSIREKILPWFMRRTYNRADAVVAVSNGVADDLAFVMGLPREHINVIYNPVVSEEIIRLSMEPLNHPWFSTGEPPVVLAAGRLTTQKDFPALIRSFSRLRASRPARLVILGEGEMRDELEALVRGLGLTEDIALPGFVENPFSWMRKSSVFVLSSAYEGLPGVLIQAMACGTPVVSTDCPSGPAEILEHGRWGRLVPVGDVPALASAIAATLDEKDHPEVTVRADAFSVDKAFDEYQNILGLNV